MFYFQGIQIHFSPHLLFQEHNFSPINDYNFDGVNSSDKEKADGLLQIFDFGNDGQISDKDALYIIQYLFY